MKFLKTALIMVLFSVLAACGGDDTSKTSDVAVIDLREILQKSPSVEKLNKKINAEIEPQQAALRVKQSGLEAKINKLNDPQLSEAEANTLKDQIIAGKKELMTQAGQLQQESVTKQNDALKTIYSKLDAVIAQYNQSKNYQFKVILKKSYVMYTAEDIDITAPIFHDFNKS